MRLSLISLELGADQVWPSSVRLRIRDCFAAFRGAPMELDPMLRPDEAGLALGAALVGGDATESVIAVQQVPLTSIAFEHPTDGFRMTADALAEHPMFTPWIGATLSAAIGKTIMRGAILTNLAPFPPLIGDLEIMACDEGLGARQRLTFSTGGAQVPVSAYYGEPIDSVSVGSLIKVEAQPLIMLGGIARTLTLQNQPARIAAVAPDPTHSGSSRPIVIH